VLSSSHENLIFEIDHMGIGSDGPQSVDPCGHARELLRLRHGLSLTDVRRFRDEGSASVGSSFRVRVRACHVSESRRSACMKEWGGVNGLGRAGTLRVLSLVGCCGVAFRGGVPIKVLAGASVVSRSGSAAAACIRAGVAHDGIVKGRMAVASLVTSADGDGPGPLPEC